MAVATGYRQSEFLQLVTAGVPWKEVVKMVARTAVATVSYYGEQAYPKNVPRKNIKRGDPIQPPKAQSWQIVCNKRAEQALYKMLSLVDTTLTDYISSVNQRMIDVGIKQREYPETDLSRSLADMNLDEFNDAIFGSDDNDTIVIAAEEYDDTDQSPPDDGWDDVEAAALEGRITDLRGSLEESQTHTLGDVAEKAVETSLYKHERHALNAMKQFDFPPGVKVVKDQKISKAGSLQVFDWLIARKAGGEEE